MFCFIILYTKYISIAPTITAIAKPLQPIPQKGTSVADWETISEFFIVAQSKGFFVFLRCLKHIPMTLKKSFFDKEAQKRKAELEQLKLELEILELKKPWYTKQAFFVPLMGALCTLFVLWITGFFNTTLDKLNVKQDRLSYETLRLEETKKRLINDSINLQNSKSDLIKDSTFLFISKYKLINDSISLENSKNKLKDDSAGLAKTKNNLLEFSMKLNSQIKKLDTEKKTILDSLTLLKKNYNIATKPHLEIIIHKMISDQDVGIEIKNTGTGVAYFKDYFVEYNNYVFKGDYNKPYWLAVADSMGINEYWLRYENVIINDNKDKTYNLGPGQSFYPIKVSPKNFNTIYASKFLSAIVGLRFKIEYCSSNDICQPADRLFTKKDIR